MISDIEIAQKAHPLPISQVAKTLGIPEDCLEPYGKTKAKIKTALNPKGHLILVSAVTPTPAGEGKTTVSVGLSDALRRLGKKTCLTLREPSLGPVFGKKGGAAGGGYAQVIPMDEINLHFTGDLHAISAANNLLCALIDNHIFHGNDLNIDEERIVHHRCIDISDRALRNAVIGVGLKGDATRREGFYITAASEVMAVLCLASDLGDLKRRLGNILIAYSDDGKPVFASDLHAEDAMTILLKDAFKPNLVQTLEGTPALIHGGPFANIAHGCNSVVATKTALTFADFVVTEAGFGFDLGGEKFLDVKCRAAGLAPSCVVIVATVRALKMHGGIAKTELEMPDVGAVKQGCDNLAKHIYNAKDIFGLSVVVGINRFSTDTDEEIAVIKEVCAQLKVPAETVDVHEKGGEGGLALARQVVTACEAVAAHSPDNNPAASSIVNANDSAQKLCKNQTAKAMQLFGNSAPRVNYLYPLNLGIKEKITAICTKLYGAAGAEFSYQATADIEKITDLGFDNLPVVIAKTQYSFSENPALFGCPTGFTITIREAQLRAGSGFIVAIAGDMMLMPGLPKSPASAHMSIDDDGTIKGLS